MCSCSERGSYKCFRFIETGVEAPKKSGVELSLFKNDFIVYKDFLTETKKNDFKPSSTIDVNWDSKNPKKKFISS